MLNCSRLIIVLVQAAQTNALSCGPAPYSDSQNLVIASIKGDLVEVQRLVAAGVDVETYFSKSQGYTPLIGAIAAGQLDIIDCLLAAGASPNLASIDGATPLNSAIRTMRTDAAERVLKAGADINFRGEDG